MELQLGIGKKEIYNRIIIAAFVVLIGLMSVGSPQQVQTIAGSIILLSVFYDPYMPLCLYICLKVMRIDFEGFWNGGMEAYTGIIAIYIIFSNHHYFSKFRPYFKCFYVFLLVLLLSFICGTRTSLMAMITQVYNILVCFAIAFFCIKKRDSMTTFALLSSGIMVLFLVWMVLRSGEQMEFDPVTGRLKYGEHVRALANALAFPIYYCIHKFFKAISNKETLKYSYLVVIALICAYFLILTMSRGAIFSVVIALFVVWAMRMKSSGIWTKALLVISFVGAVYFVQSIEFNEDYFFNKLDTLTGRDVIWEFYWTKQVQSGILTILFGFGPGNVMRVATGTAFDGAYAHSFFAAFLFSYGVLGFLVLLSLVFLVGKSIWRNRDIESIGLFIMTVLLFIPHGSEGTALFYYLFGACMGRTILRNHSKLANQKV